MVLVLACIFAGCHKIIVTSKNLLSEISTKMRQKIAEMTASTGFGGYFSLWISFSEP